MTKAIMHWSGGKDSALCLYRLRQSRTYDEIRLLTTVNKAFGRISMHGVRTELLLAQAAAIGLPVEQLALPETISMTEYSTQMRQKLTALCQQGFTDSVFGDIFLTDLRQYREKQLAEANMHGVFPLWQEKPERLMREFIDQGFKAILVCVAEKTVNTIRLSLTAQFLNNLYRLVLAKLFIGITVQSMLMIRMSAILKLPVPGTLASTTATYYLLKRPLKSRQVLLLYNLYYVN